MKHSARDWVVVSTMALLAVGSSRGVGADGEPAAQARPILVAQVGHGNTVTSVAVSHDGRLVLTGSFDRTARLWNLASGREVGRFEGTESVVASVAFSAEGASVLTGHFDGSAREWERDSSKEVRAYRGHGERVVSAVFSADGRWILTGSWDATARLWERASGREMRRFSGHSDKVTSVALSGDGRHVLTGSHDKTARLWDLATGAEVRRFQGHGDRVSSVAFTRDGASVITASDDRTARLWERASGREVRRFAGHGDRLTSATASADGRWLATGSWDATARVWDLASGAEVRRLTGHGSIVSSVAFLEDGLSVLTGSHDFTARLWGRENGTELRRYAGRSSAVRAVAVSPDGRWLVTGHDAHVATLWDRDQGRAVGQLAGHTERVTSVALSGDGLWVVTGSDDKSARLWERESGKEVRRLNGHSDKVAAVAVSADGRLALTGSDDKSARMWDLASGKELRQFVGHTDRVAGVALSADGRWALTASHDRTARVWERESGREVARLQGHQSQVSCVALSADGRWVVTGGLDKSARLWDRESGREVRRFEGHVGWLTGVAVSPDGARVATASMDGKGMLWDRESGKRLQVLEGHGGSVAGVAFSADGRWLLTASADSTTRAWEAESGKLLCSLISFLDGTWAVVDPEARYDASGQGRVEGLHWVVGREVIVLEQLMSTYYEPGLLTRLLRPAGAAPLRLLRVPAFHSLGMFPELRVAPPAGPDALLKIDLKNRGGGIGKVVVKIDGTAIAADVHAASADPDADSYTVTVPLAGQPMLAPGRSHAITVEAYNAEGSLRSRGFELPPYVAPGSASTGKAAEFWVVVAGASTYAGPALNLAYAAKDAEDFSAALSAAAAVLYGAEHLHIQVLTTNAAREPPTRANLLRALEAVRKAAPDDVFVLYLAGHGATHGTPPDYYYMTQEATTLDLREAAERTQRAISAQELEEALRQIPARRRIVVLDTCRAGSATGDLSRGEDGGADQMKVVARVRQSVGTYVLAGCAAGGSSYETSRLAQGLLTYALLEGMKLAAAPTVHQGDVLEAGGLLLYAQRRVPDLAKGMPDIQQPQLTAPDNATPINVGRLTPPVREGIRLAGGLVQVGRPSVELGSQPDDPLGLQQAVEGALLAAAKRDDAGFEYAPERHGPGVVRIAGRYTVEGAKVHMVVYLKRLTADGSENLGTFPLEGSTAEAAALATRLVSDALSRVRGR